MTLTQLSYIVALDKYKNFSQAAEHCRITQPTLSMQIQKLEDEFGIILFDRTLQPVQATKIGKTIVVQARIILNESQKLNDLVQEDKGEVKGEVTLAVIPTLAPYILPLFLKKFRILYPEVSLKIEELQTHQIIERISNNTLDIALLVTPIDDENLISNPLFYEPFHVYCSDKHELFLKNKILMSDLVLADMWMLTEGHCFRDQTLAVCKNKKKSSDEFKNIKFESGSLETLKRMVDLEGGFTLVPFLATMDILNTKKVKEFVTPVPTREVSLVHSKFFKRDALKKAISDIIQKSIPVEIPQLPKKTLQVIDLPLGRK